MRNIVFTIVAKNYLPLARALGWSLKNNNNAPIDYIIFVADELDETVDLNSTEERIIPASKIGIENLKDWAFKYNVTEFCTAVKPSCFKYIFQTLNAEKAIYFDPDIFVFNSLQPIFDTLDTAEIIVTPHYITPQIPHQGDQKETMTLFVGIYNFGFIAFKNSKRNELILNWWENRLSDQCYGDRQDALHTDQRWGDFLPVYATDTLHISKSIGYNLAPWNLFEREIFKDVEALKVKNRITGEDDILTFVHFAGFDPNDLKLIHKDFWDMPIEKYPEYDLVRNEYLKITDKFDFGKVRNANYSYNSFSNGIYIQEYHRRFYRSLTENGNKFNDPFDASGPFYQMLDNNNLIVKTKPAKQNRKNYAGFNSKLNKVNKGFRLIHKIIGTEKYFLLMKLMNRYSRPENQVFLLNEPIKKIY